MPRSARKPATLVAALCSVVFAVAGCHHEHKPLPLVHCQRNGTIVAC